MTRGSSLIGQDLRRTTLLLWVIWATASFSYYGVVLMSAELFESPGQLCSAATGALSQVLLAATVRYYLQYFSDARVS